ncbi:hypothetical protein ACHAXT_011728 [Thalassiosira profunda]
MSGNEDENEETSLLHSASAPPRPSLLNPYNPRNPPPQQNQEQFYNKPRHTLTSANLAAMEASAARLAGDDNLDSDSVNGLLAGMEASDDEASAFGERAALDDRPVTMQELEFLAKSRRAASDLGMEGADDRELERRDSDELREESFRQQSAHDDKGMFLSARMHESTRALRVATGDGIRRNTSVGGGIVPPLKRPSSHAEIEPGDKEPLEMEEGKRPRLSIQVITMVTLTVLVVLLIFAALALGTLAVGPPRQPLGEYRILEAQTGNDFWRYYDFYAGKDSAGSNGYITYVSREVAEKDDIIGVVTEEVAEEDMIEIYEDGDSRAVEDWLAEDLEFLDWLERKKEALEDSKAFGGDEVKSNETDGESDDSSSAKGKEKAAPKKKSDNKHRSLLGDEASGPSPEFEPFAPLRFQNTTTDDAPPPRLEPFNPDPPRNGTDPSKPTETFVMISSSPTPEGPRNSVRLEGRRRFNRGLFIIDLRHMPAGCGTWPAFWLTDEANWPVNGEIDIVEGVNYQDTVKTALHSTKECVMNDVPEGSKTGSWDTAVGVPDGKTGKPDMTFRWAQNCFVYDPHQWINQGCVATDLKLEGRSLGMPLNANGGGVYALEWDPVNRHIRTYVFSPHNRVPRNLREALRTARDPETAVAPDPNQWGLPYGHFPIGEGTNCPAGHFRNMRLVINLAFCGSVAGNRYFMDCPKKFKKYKTCNEWVKSDPEELKEAYWKIRGVYVYEREWERQWT